MRAGKVACRRVHSLRDRIRTPPTPRTATKNRGCWDMKKVVLFVIGCYAVLTLGAAGAYFTSQS
jgi:hypothetical protein